MLTKFDTVIVELVVEYHMVGSECWGGRLRSNVVGG